MSAIVLRLQLAQLEELQAVLDALKLDIRLQLKEKRKMATRLGNFVAYALLAAIAGVALGLLSLIPYPIEQYGVIPNAPTNPVDDSDSDSLVRNDTLSQ